MLDNLVSQVFCQHHD